ncbi:MAG: MotA/TolQ/ExbB proton channel family protein [Flavobacteriales bacterium]
MVLQARVLIDNTVPWHSNEVTQTRFFSLWGLVTEGGMVGSMIIFIIFILFIIGLYIFFERIFVIRTSARVDRYFTDHITDMVYGGKFEAAVEYCQNNPTPEAKMMEKGLERMGRPLSDITQAMQNTGKLEIYRLEKGLRTLAMISRVAPMLGFLGTVIGMIMAFYQIAHVTAQVNPQVLAAGIYTAMNTTAVGLVVGICIYIFYNLLVVRIDRVFHRMEAVATYFLDMINKPLL